MDNRKTKKNGRRIKWLLISGLLTAVLVVAGIGALANEYLFIREMNFYGNRHLSEDDLKALTGCSTKSRLFSISASEIYRRLRTSPWVKDAMVRKDLTGRLDIYLTESVAIGVLLADDKPWLIDREGVRLEAIRPEQSYFLPLIKTDPSASSEAYQEAVSLATVLHDRKLMAQAGNTEITGTRPEDITMKADDLVIKIGAGEFHKKLEKLNFVKEEIARRNMKVEYVDLRFADKIVVKPHKQSGADEDGKGVPAVRSKKAPGQGTNKGTGGKGKKNVG